MKRPVLVGLSVLVVGLAGCSSENAPEATSTPATSSVAAASDEQQIRELVAKQEAAIAGYNFAKMAELTCAQYRDAVLSQPDTMFPPLSQAGTPEELAAKPADVLTEALKRKYPAASDAVIGQLVDALIRYDEPAYKAANLELLRQSSKLTIDKVENITVTGDSATADITTTWALTGQPPATDTKPNAFRKEGGRWLDCQDPSSE
ncbi:hypothetical protein [Mycobacterium sp. DL440]|uniref:hypothetical protein n=1 Tax=Mycobacterium sp. DL440 TaxID=2675523 RepID=UPI001422CCC2|nr:hypothetical protein [Mycobacterium sp. DL440]